MIQMKYIGRGSTCDRDEIFAFSVSFVQRTQFYDTLWCGVKRRPILIFLTMILLSSYALPGTVYYVDATHGRNSNSGLSASAAWKTIAKINKYLFAPGDKILFKRGETWREILEVSSNGMAGFPITYGAYGEGPKPRILGSTAKNSASDWTRERGNLWYARSNTKVLQCVFKNGNAYSRRVSRKNDLKTQGKIWWDKSNKRVYLYSKQNPATYYSNSIELCKLPSIIYIRSKSHIKFKGLDIRNTSGNAIYGNNSHHITVHRCTLKFTGETYSANTRYGEWSGAGIWFSQGTELTVTNCIISYNWVGVYFKRSDGSPARHTIDNNTFSYQIFGYNMRSHGIAFGGVGPFPNYAGTVIKNNTIHHFGMKGIALSHSKNVTVEHNTIHTNYGDGFNRYCSGISMGSTTSKGHIIRYNHIYNLKGNPYQWNDGCGIRTREARNCKIYYNIIHDCIKGIYVQPKTANGNNDNNEIYNNVCYNCSMYGIWINHGINGNVLAVSISNNISDGSAADIRLEKNVKATGGFNCLMNDYLVSSLGTYSGSSRDFYKTKPLFKDAPAGDFSLRQGSPCIDTGTGVGINKDYAGNDVPSGAGVDMGALEFTTEPQAAESKDHH